MFDITGSAMPAWDQLFDTHLCIADSRAYVLDKAPHSHNVDFAAALHIHAGEPVLAQCDDKLVDAQQLLAK